MISQGRKDGRALIRFICLTYSCILCVYVCVCVCVCAHVELRVYSDYALRWM